MHTITKAIALSDDALDLRSPPRLLRAPKRCHQSNQRWLRHRVSASHRSVKSSPSNPSPLVGICPAYRLQLASGFRLASVRCAQGLDELAARRSERRRCVAGGRPAVSRRIEAAWDRAMPFDAAVSRSPKTGCDTLLRRGAREARQRMTKFAECCPKCCPVK